MQATPTERVVTDYYSGLAIGGYDPVAYFTDREARPGAQDVEASWGGAIWRFRNDRNKAVFLANPEIYGPQFGGYDPFDLARGKIVAGRPGVWLITGQRLYLFNKTENRDAFAKDLTRLSKATGNWPTLSATLSDY
ncbi:MAG: hypothetical protein K2W78_03545 [Xanthobacteraceae bacterium]|nr:hypothetical protein [Xanthobacteraceae bacterium]